MNGSTQVRVVMGLFVRRVARNPLVLVYTLLLPVLVAFIFGSADERATSRVSVGIVTSELPTEARSVRTELAHTKGLDVREYEHWTSLEVALRRGDVAAAFRPSPSFQIASAFGQPKLFDIIGDPNSRLFVTAKGIASGVGAPASTASRVTIETVATRAGGQSRGLARAAAGMLVFWVFANASVASAMITEDRRSGVIERLRSGPVPAWAIAVGEVGARWGVAVAQALIIAGASWLAFGTAWGEFVPFVVLIALAGATAAGASVLLGAALRRPGPAAATSATAVLAVSGLLAGCFWPLSNTPRLMQDLALLTPQAWIMRGLQSLGAQGEGFGAIAGDLLVLAAFTCVLVAGAVRMLTHDRRGVRAPA